MMASGIEAREESLTFKSRIPKNQYSAMAGSGSIIMYPKSSNLDLKSYDFHFLHV